MEGVYIVVKEFPNYDLVDDDLDIMMYDPCEICAVFKKEEDAAAWVKEMNELLAESAQEDDEDEEENDPNVVYVYGKWDVR